MMAKRVTEEQLVEWKRLVGEATPGPWVEDDGNIFSRPLSDQREAQIMRMLDDPNAPHPDAGRSEPLGFVATTTQETDNFESNAAFISAAREAVSALLDEVEELRAEIQCDGCLGVGKSLGGYCGCGGTGRLSDMLTAVRKRFAAVCLEVERLRMALQEIVDHDCGCFVSPEIARRALEE